ncbi:MAG: glycoside hydrolase family 3 N-terminal domain-containing protein [Steroidobacteraceae bacterium]
MPTRALLLSVLMLFGSPQSSQAEARGTSDVHPADWPTLPRAVPAQPDVEKFVQQLLDAMTLEEKVGQLIQADIASIKPADLAQYPLGSILAGGGAAPGGDVHATGAQWLELTDAFFRASTGTRGRRSSSAHPPIPILFGIDAVHGHAKVRGATIFPHNVGLGAAHDPALIEKIGRATAEEVAATGIDWTFAPTVAVVRDVRWGRSYESYSEDPAIVADYARAMVTGVQGKLGTADFLAPGHTLVSAKHFLGDGGTIAGRDQFNNLADEGTLREVHAAGYTAAISAGALIVMGSYNGWHGVKMHANKPLLTDVLKDRWNFPGFVVGDWNAHEEIPGCTKLSCPEALNAGLDMYMAPDSWKQLYTHVLEQVRSGQIAQARVDDAVRRILRVKAVAGEFKKRPPKDRSVSRQLATIGSAAHREIARQAVRESLVLLKNNGHALPLDPHSRILVTGAGADDIGMQSGGWTVDWQGDHNTNADFPGATSILAGIQAAVRAAGGEVTTRVEDINTQKPAAAIVVYGETPYAEFQGDRETLEFSAPAQLATLSKLHAAKIPVISLFISGRPLWVNRELNLSDAFVAVWLPGSEGNGIADLLFKPLAGHAARDFTGRLSFSWPSTAMPVVFDSDNTVRGALFPRGFGLSLASSEQLARLPEDPQIPAFYRDRDTLFHAGHVTAPWSLYVSDPLAEVRVTMQSQNSPGTAVTAQLTSQGVRATWSGQGTGEFRIGGRPIGLQTLSAGAPALRLHYRIDEMPQQPVILTMRCEGPAGSPAPAAGSTATGVKRCGMEEGEGVDLTQSFRSAQAGSWVTLTVPLTCLHRGNGNSELVSAPFALESSGRLDVSFDDIRLVRDPTAACPPRRP